jgi:ubiquinone/menaquinone biosynthesis C-methylase UbiE
MTTSLKPSNPVQAVWQAFDHAADSYDHASQLQHLSADYLYSLMTAESERPSDPAAQWLDVGSGTGAMAKKLAADGRTVIAVDQSPAMLAHVHEVAAIQTLQADMRKLPLADQSVDALVSHFALHWLQAAEVLPELVRVVKPGGILWLAFPIEGSLADVVARYPLLPVFDFPPARQWREAVTDLAQLEVVAVQAQLWSQAFPSLRELLHSLKRMGGNRTGRAQQPVAPAVFRTWLRDEWPITLQYQVLYLQLRVKSSS